MLLRFSINKIKEKPIFTIFTIIQIIISILLVYKIFLVNENLNNSKNLIKGILNENNYYKNKDYLFIDDEKVQYNKIFNIINKLDNNKDFATLSCYKDSSLIAKEDLLEESIVDYDGYEFNNKTYLYADTYIMNNNFLEKLNLKYFAGNSEKFKGGIIKNDLPVILGYEYNQKYKVGDKITYYSADENGKTVSKNMVVIGILEKYMYTTESVEFKGIYSLDYSFIIPFTFEQPKNDAVGSEENAIKMIDIIYYLKGCFFQSEDIKEVNKVFNEYKINNNFTNVDNIIKNIGSDDKQMYSIIFFICCIIIIFTVISIIIVMLKSFKKDFKEYGVHLLIGANQSNIINIVLGQVLILFILSISIAIITGILINIKLVMFTLNIKAIIYTILVFFIITSIICFIIKKVISKYSVNEIIKRG